MSMPPTQGPARDQYILDAIDSGNIEYKWAHVTLSAGGHTGTFAVFARPMKVDGIYVGVGARILQDITDKLGCSFLTMKLQDQMYEQAATKILPYLNYSPTMMQSTEWFQKSTTGIDAMLATAGYAGGIAMGIGKPWQLTNLLVTHPGRAVNYGLYVPKAKVQGTNYLGVHASPTVTPTGAMVLQDPGWAHGIDQDDYSELISLVSRQCVIDGALRDFSDVVRDPELSRLVSHEGPLQVVRQPGVPIRFCPTPSTISAAPMNGDGSDGKSVCPIQLTGLPSEDAPPAPPEPPAAPPKTSSGVVPAIAGIAGAGIVAAGAWWFLRRRRR